MDFVRLFELPMKVSILQSSQLLLVDKKVGYLNYLRSKHPFGNLKGHSWVNMNSTQGVKKCKAQQESEQSIEKEIEYLFQGILQHGGVVTSRLSFGGSIDP